MRQLLRYPFTMTMDTRQIAIANESQGIQQSTTVVLESALHRPWRSILQNTTVTKSLQLALGIAWKQRHHREEAFSYCLLQQFAVWIRLHFIQHNQDESSQNIHTRCTLWRLCLRTLQCRGLVGLPSAESFGACLHSAGSKRLHSCTEPISEHIRPSISTSFSSNVRQTYLIAAQHQRLRNRRVANRTSFCSNVRVDRSDTLHFVHGCHLCVVTSNWSLPLMQYDVTTCRQHDPG